MDNSELEEFRDNVKKAIAEKDYKTLGRLSNVKNIEKSNLLYQYLHKELRLNENNIVIREILGKLSLRKGEFDKARKFFSYVMDKSYDAYNRAYGLIDLAKVDLYSGRLDDCRKKLDVIRNVDNNDIKRLLYFTLGVVDYYENNYEIAIDNFKKSLMYNVKAELDIKYDIYKYIGFCYYKIGKMNDALEYFIKYLDIRGRHFDPGIVMTIFYICKNNNMQ